MGTNEGHDRAAAGPDGPPGAHPGSGAEERAEATVGAGSGADRLEAPKRILIFSGGTLGDWALQEIREEDLLIGADRGALFLVQSGRIPDLALGDFDSVTLEEKATIRVRSRVFQECDPVKKDWTDTEMAFLRALEWRPVPSEIVLLGVLGTRFDHALANVQLLRLGLERGIRCSIRDENNRITLMDGREPMEIEGNGFTHVSLLPLSTEVTGITLEGFRYPLTDATLTVGQSLGISNVLQEKRGRIQARSGLLLVIQSKD